MGTSVVLEAEPLVAVLQVRSAYEAMEAIANGDLRFRPGQAGEHQQHSQPGFHGGL